MIPDPVPPSPVVRKRVVAMNVAVGLIVGCCLLASLLASVL